jgi:hypothetical protein
VWSVWGSGGGRDIKGYAEIRFNAIAGCQVRVYTQKLYSDGWDTIPGHEKQYNCWYNTVYYWADTAYNQGDGVVQDLRQNL